MVSYPILNYLLILDFLALPTIEQLLVIHLMNLILAPKDLACNCIVGGVETLLVTIWALDTTVSCVDRAQMVTKHRQTGRDCTICSSFFFDFKFHLSRFVKSFNNIFHCLQLDPSQHFVDYSFSGNVIVN